MGLRDKVTHKKGYGYDISVGLPNTIPVSLRWSYGESQYKENYFSGESKEYRNGREVSFGYAFLSVNSTTYNEPGTQFDQTTTTFTTGDAFFNFAHENDVHIGNINKHTLGFIPSAGGDKYRTAALSTTVGFMTFSSNMFTGEPQKYDGNVINNNGIYQEDYPYRMGTYEIGFGPFKVGVDYEGIRHVIQNRFSHDFLTGGESKWFQKQKTKPKFYSNISSGGGTL